MAKWDPLGGQSREVGVGLGVGVGGRRGRRKLSRSASGSKKWSGLVGFSHVRNKANFHFCITFILRLSDFEALLLNCVIRLFWC